MKKIFTIALLVASTFCFSQAYELGKVTIDELKQKVCPTDTSAVAAYLFNIAKTHFNYSGDEGFEIITEIDVKIKIYKKEGYEYANHSEDLYIGNRGTERIDISKAATYNLVGDKIVKSKLGNDGEFVEKVNQYWNRKKITMPNVKEGSIIEYRITLRSPYFSNFPDWEFQKDIPVNYSEYRTNIPEYFTYNTYFKGYFAPESSKEIKNRQINYSYTLSPSEVLQRGLNTGKVNSSIDFSETITKFFIANVPPLKNEVFVNNINNYRCTVVHELAGTKFPNANYESYSTNWESVVKTIYQDQNFGGELNKTGYFEKDIDAIINGISSFEERAGLIFNYVKSKINWNETFGVYCPDGVKKAYQEKKGSAAEINLMLTAMLRYAGVDANPILVSTRSNGISIFPSRSAYNYVISGIELQNQVLLLDATNRYSLPNILPIRDLNWFGRIIRKNESSAQIDLMPKSNSTDVLNLMATVDSQGEVSGKIRQQYFDYNAFLFRNSNNGLSKESAIDKLEKKYSGLEIGEYEVQNSTDLSKQIVENYDFKTNNAVEIIGDKMYFSPFLFLAITENPFKQEEREYPVDFVFPNQDKFNISLKIPDGYTVETLPKSISVAMPDNLGSFKYNISNNGSQVQLVSTVDINQAIINAEDYEALKNFFKEIVNKQTEKIVLKKG